MYIYFFGNIIRSKIIIYLQSYATKLGFKAQFINNVQVNDKLMMIHLKNALKSRYARPLLEKVSSAAPQIQHPERMIINE